MEILQSDLCYSTHVLGKMHTKRCLPQEALFSSSVFTADGLIDHLVKVWCGSNIRYAGYSINSFIFSSLRYACGKGQTPYNSQVREKPRSGAVRVWQYSALPLTYIQSSSAFAWMLSSGNLLKHLHSLPSV